MKKDLRTVEGQVYQKIDNAIIEYTEYTENCKRDLSYSSKHNTPSTDFSMNNNNKWSNIQYENSTFGIIRLSNTESNNAYMLEWIGNDDQPKIISGWSQDNTKYFHILLRNNRGDRNRDIVHLKYNQTNAMRLLKMYNNLFPNASKSK